MNADRLDTWKDSVREHSRMMATLVNDSLVIKKLMIDYLKQYFDFDEIQFSNDFTRISLKWSYEHEPFINPEELSCLGMEFIITHDYSETLGHGVVIEVYPFGLPMEED